MHSFVQISYFVMPSAVLFFLVRKYRLRHPPKTHTCLWLIDHHTETDLTAWVCQTCGEQAFSAGDQPPSDCKKLTRAWL